ncbi:universal stress protein [Massilia sp. W12]|uniref:universal stress protein n=1 Tax=Massilia sp. W12 TaxID=3126507 RepID=UPI0030D2A928
MSYKTILVHVDETKRCKARLALAAHMAQREQAHVVGVAMTGISRFIYQNARFEDCDPNLSLHLDFLRERAKKALAAFEPEMRALGVDSVETHIVDDEAGAGLCLHARYADLVIIGQTDLDEVSPSVLPDFPQQVVLHAQRPVLVLPYVGEFDTAQHPIGKRILLAWNGGKEAVRAVTYALPILQQAELVQIAVFDPDEKPGIHGDEPGADIALYLARHGVKAEASVHYTDEDRVEKRKLDVGNALLSLANDFGSDMLVMGAYGHSRWRETFLGGVTKTILESMTIPVLMAH